MADNILEVRNLKVSFRTNNGTVKAVRDVSFNLEKGKTLAIVGESGSGKSVTSKVIMGISAANAIIEGGEVLYDGKDLTKITEEAMCELRGDKIAMIFQDPLSSLDPIVRIGKQITEAMILKNRLTRKVSRKEFNYQLAVLKDYMHKTFDNDPEVTKEEIDNKIKEFDDFNIVGITLEESYNDSCNYASDAQEKINDLLFIASKNRKQPVLTKLNTIYKILLKIQDKFLINNYNEEIVKINNFFTAYAEEHKGEKNVVASPEVIKNLEDTNACLKDMLSREKPNFFRFGYYIKHNPEADLTTMDVNQANDMTLKYLDENFMKRFIYLAKGALKASYDEHIETKKAAVSFLQNAIDVFRGDFTKESANEIVKNAKDVINASIDQLAIEKDTVAMTFNVALKGFVKKYFATVKENIKEDKRIAAQTAKREALIAQGKHIDWKVVPKKALDPESIRNDILLLCTRLTEKYTKFIDNSKNIVFEELCIAMIDKFKAKASSVVYKVTYSVAKERALKLMEEVGIPEPRIRFYQYPFEFSGGMRQRIVIAIALAANPEILICDEPTTALDVTIQSQILELINKLKVERNLSVIFVTHDLGVVANMADTIAVMYAGKIVEYGTSEDIFYSPAHPYTWALLSSMPDLDTKEKLEAIPGTPPNMIYPPVGDAFAARNKYALKIDFEKQPPMFKISDTHSAATWLLHPNAPKIAMPKIISDRIKRMNGKGE